MNKRSPVMISMTSNPSTLITKQQDRILASAKVCFIKRGLAHTTMRDIAKQADMSLGNIYRYFKNKALLIQAFIEKDNQEVDAAFLLLDQAKDFKKTLHMIANEYIEDLSVKAELLVYIDILSEALRNQKIVAIIELEKGEQTLAQVLNNAHEQGRVKLSIPVETAAFAIISFMESAALKCLINADYFVASASEQFAQFIDVIILE